MITLQLPQQEWETATTYCHDLSNNDKVTKDDTLFKKIKFLNESIFNKNKIVENGQLNLNVPSVGAMTQLMNEIENDIEAAKTTFSLGGSSDMMRNDVDDTKDSGKEILDQKENKKLKEFVCKPV